MYPYIVIGGSTIHAWSLCLHVSYITAIACFVYFRPKDFELSRLQLLAAGALFAISGFFGAKLIGILNNYINHPGVATDIIIKRAGMAYLGTPLLGFTSLWIFSALTYTSFLKNADYIAPFIMLSRAIGRVGCLLNGCCYGIPCKLPWAITIYSRPGLRHPTQAYAAIAAFAIFITMLIQYRLLRQYKGATFFGVITLYSLMRFFNEFLRADSFYVLGLIKFSHIIMLLLFTTGLIGLRYSLKGARDQKGLLGDTLFYFASALFWTAFVALGILASIQFTNAAIPLQDFKKRSAQLPPLRFTR